MKLGLIKKKKKIIISSIGILIFITFILFACFPSLFAKQDPYNQDVGSRLQSISSEHLFGTDELGRDIYSRCIFGARSSLIVALVAVVFSCLLGITLGLFSGYQGGFIDTILSSANDVLVSFPAMIIALALIAVIGQNILAVGFVIGLVNIPVFFRVTRAIAQKVKNLAYVEAVQTYSTSMSYLLFRTVLPNCLNEINYSDTYGR